MERSRILEELIKNRGYNLKSFAAKCCIPYTTLYGIIKNGVGKASVDNVMVICHNLGISIEELEEMATGAPIEKYNPGFEDVERMIARNGNEMSTDQKMRLIQLLSEIRSKD